MNKRTLGSKRSILYTPKNELSLNEEFMELRKHVKEQILKFIVIKTENGTIKEKISFYCKNFGIIIQGLHNYLKYKDKSWKYKVLADAMLDICV